MPDRWLSFDCYGTLVDWRSGMTAALETVHPGGAEALLEAYYANEPAVQAERPFRSYRTVLAEALRRAAAQLSVDLPPGGDQVLGDTLPSWPVFPEVPDALRAVRAAGWRLAVLSNVDRDLIAGTLVQFPEPFDLVVTAEDVESYKPGLVHFRRFAERTGARTASWVHVGASRFHDVEPTRALGVRCVWVDREGERQGDDAAGAAAVVADLAGLAGAVAALVAPRRAEG